MVYDKEMKHMTPYRQNETSLSPVRGGGMVLVSNVSVLLHPILNLQTRYTLKVVGVACHNNKVLMQCRNSYKHVHVANLLVNPQGIIIAADLRGKALTKKLEEIFNDK